LAIIDCRGKRPFGRQPIVGNKGSGLGTRRDLSGEMTKALGRTDNIGAAVKIEDRGLGLGRGGTAPPAPYATDLRSLVADAVGRRGLLHQVIERSAAARPEIGGRLHREHRAHCQHRGTIEQMLFVPD
jgi:hypothetical protein